MPANNSASVRVGFEALRVNPLRTLLSTLGVIMGVGSMVSVLAMGDGVEKYARDQVAKTTDLQAVSVSPNTVQRLDGIFTRRADVILLGLADVAASRHVVVLSATASDAIADGTAGAGPQGVRFGGRARALRTRPRAPLS